MDINNDMLINLSPGKVNFNISCTVDDWRYIKDLEARKLFLYGPIASISDATFGECSSEELVENIMNINRMDQGIDPKERKPIKLYINSPGGDMNEGFAVISAIELSKTPIYTINIGQWSSMAFLIGIAGHKRFSLPYSTFLMHDGSQIALGSTNKVHDQMEFMKRFEDDVVKVHILKYSQMSSEIYDKKARLEFYMLPEDALHYKFIDKIITDIDEVL